MLKKLNLTEKEMTALHGLVASCAGNGYDFGFTDEGCPADWKPRSWSAVIGSLTKKGIFAWAHDLGEDDGVDCRSVQMQLTPDAYYTAGCVAGLQWWEGNARGDELEELDEAIQQLSHAEVEAKPRRQATKLEWKREDGRYLSKHGAYRIIRAHGGGWIPQVISDDGQSYGPLGSTISVKLAVAKERCLVHHTTGDEAIQQPEAEETMTDEEEANRLEYVRRQARGNEEVARRVKVGEEEDRPGRIAIYTVKALRRYTSGSRIRKTMVWVPNLFPVADSTMTTDDGFTYYSSQHGEFIETTKSEIWRKLKGKKGHELVNAYVHGDLLYVG